MVAEEDAQKEENRTSSIPFFTTHRHHDTLSVDPEQRSTQGTVGTIGGIVGSKPSDVQGSIRFIAIIHVTIHQSSVVGVVVVIVIVIEIKVF